MTFFIYLQKIRKEKHYLNMLIILLNHLMSLLILYYERVFTQNKIKVLLLEKVDDVAIKLFKNEDYSVETYEGSMDEDELIKKINDVSILEFL